MGEAGPACALGQDSLQRCRRALGPDHATTLLASAALILALVTLGQAEPARALGQDILQRARHVLGPHNPIALSLTEVASGGHPMPGGDTAAARPDRPL